jgi:hypothetical protein
MLKFFRKLIFGNRYAQVKNIDESLSVSIGECIATFTSELTGESIVFSGETFYNDDQLLGEITLDEDRGQRFGSADGKRDVVMQNLRRAGERDITFLLGTGLDKLKSWAQTRVQPVFQFDFYYKYDTQSADQARIQRHKRCFFKTMPIQAIGRSQGYVTCKISFGDIAEVDPSTGTEL